MAKDWSGIHDDDKQAAMRHWSRRPQLPVPYQSESDRTLSHRIERNIDELERVERLDRCIFGTTPWYGPGLTRWPFNKPGVAE